MHNFSQGLRLMGTTWHVWLILCEIVSANKQRGLIMQQLDESGAWIPIEGNMKQEKEQEPEEQEEDQKN